jgi:hypothetical protein
MSRKRKWRGNVKIVGQDGPNCPRCERPTEIREHAFITTKMLQQPFYYSRWYNCTNKGCITTLIMPKEFMVWAVRGKEAQKAKRQEAHPPVAKGGFTDAEIELPQEGDEPPF